MAKKKDSLPLIINRTAINPLGRIGSLYNCYHDFLFESTDFNSNISSERIFQKAQCTLFIGNNKQSPLEIINIDEQLRLSLLLNLTPKTGLATILDHSHVINECTRLLRYTYLYREETFSEDTSKLREYLPLNVSELSATHIITNIGWGIDIVVILQLPSDDQLVPIIDQTLEKYQRYLDGSRNDFRRTRDDIQALEKILDTKIYSNLSQLNQITSLHELFHQISQLKNDETIHQPMNYTLYPIQSFIHSNVYIPVDSIINSKLENYLYELFISIKTLEICFNENMQNLLCGHFKDRLTTAYKRWSIVQNEYAYILEQFTKLIVEIRSGQIRISTIDKKLRSKTQIEIKNSVQNLADHVLDLNAKAHLISELGYQRIQYCNVIEHNINNTDTDETIRQKLIVDETSDRVLCSNDQLNQKNPDLFRELKRNLLEEYAKNIKLRLIYADFSYSNCPLKNMMILTNKRKSQKNQTNSTPKSRLNIDRSSTRLQTDTETLNILLLGETGVGKSTFINSIINYLTFSTFEEAQSSKPLVAIPVSFVLTAGEHFTEYIVKFEDEKTSKTENFDQIGQSVTQFCKSYVYNLNAKVRIRFIDTPGFGDTRGIDQDHQNLQQIIYYLKKYRNLNAICFLLKSNETRLNMFFRSCFIQLHNLFGPNIASNLLFCFTNTRSTFYTPGNTPALIKAQLNGQISLKRRNMFCFDNEAFRYLIATQNRISFHDQEKQVYEQSWDKSLRESFRFIRYIRKKLTKFPIPDESEAIKDVKIKLVHLTHPMLEAMRSILRTIILRKMHSLQNGLSNHVINDEENRIKYQSMPDRPVSLNFLEGYVISSGPLGQKQDELIDHLSLFCYLSAELSYFLVYIAYYRNGDPFLNGLLRLIKEENAICEAENQNYINLQLVDGLKKLTMNYEQRLQTLKLNCKQTSPTDIHEWIKYIDEYPLITNYIIDSTRTHLGNASRVSIV